MLALAPAAWGSGTYHVNAVYDLTTGAAAPCDNWTGPWTAPDGYTGTTICTSGGSMWASLFAGTSHAYGDNAHLVFTAPANTRISAFTLRRNSSLGSSQPYGTPVQFVNYDSNSIESCVSAYGCSGKAEGTVGASNINAGSITAGIDCGGGPGGSCPAGAASTLNVDGGDIVLTSSNSPSTSNVSGPLTNSGATLSGTRSISYNATDQAGGVYSGTLIVDGNPLVSAIANTNGGRCQALRVNGDGSRVFNYVVPCPQTTSGSVSLDTSQLADGVHTVQLVVDDVAGNQTVAYNSTITTHNAPVSTSAPTIVAPASTPQEGQTLSVADTGGWSPAASYYTYQWYRCDAAGAACKAISAATNPSYVLTASDDYHTVYAAITGHNAAGASPPSNSNTLGPVADSKGNTTPPAPSTTGASSAGGLTGNTTAGTTSATTTSTTTATTTSATGAGATTATPAPCTPVVTTNVAQQPDGTYALSGSVTCNGVPVSGAKVTVSDGSGLARTITANGDGTFSTIIKTLHDGLAVSYGGQSYPVAHPGRGRLSLRVAPSSARNHHTITFTGKLTGIAMAAGAKQVLLIEYRALRKWHPFDKVALRNDGSFVYSYRFKRTTHTTIYHFRVELPSVGASPGRTVRVTP